MRRSTTHRRKSVLRDPRGFSSIVGTIFMVLVVLLVSTSVFLWTLAQNTSYNETLKQQSQEEINRRNENIVITWGNYSASENMVRVEAILTNAGPVTATIVNLWVFDTSKQTYGFNNSFSIASQAILNPGQTLSLSGDQAVNVSVQEAQSSDTFSIYFVTARGNTVPLPPTKQDDIIVAQVAQGIGSVAMDFDTFVFYHVESVSGIYRMKQSEWPNGNSGFTVPCGQSVAFRVTLTNFNPQKRAITLNSHSVLWMIFPATAQQPRSTWWYVVNVDGNGIIGTTFTTITLSWGMQAQIFFASVYDNSFSPSSISSPIAPNQPAAVNLILLGKIGSDASFGQNIPFVSVYVN